MNPQADFENNIYAHGTLDVERLIQVFLGDTWSFHEDLPDGKGSHYKDTKGREVLFQKITPQQIEISFEGNTLFLGTPEETNDFNAPGTYFHFYAVNQDGIPLGKGFWKAPDKERAIRDIAKRYKTTPGKVGIVPTLPKKNRLLEGITLP